MHRTTIYLPDELRDQLARAAREDHRSEADLIREGVERVLRQRLLRDTPPEPRIPLIDSGHPGLGLALDWFFQDTPVEKLDWLVADCKSVWAQQLTAGGSFYEYHLSFRGADDHEEWSWVRRGPITKLAQTWSDICWSLELWLRAVMDGRERPEGFEAIVVRYWQPDQPPVTGAAAVEIAHVEVGPRVAGPAISSR